MSIFPESVIGETISEIRVRSNEEKLVACLNELRFRPQILYKHIIDFLKNHKTVPKEPNSSACAISFPQLNDRRIQCHSSEQIDQAINYFSAFLNMSELLSDLYYNQEHNFDFCKIFNKQGRDTGLEESFRNKYKISALAYYFFDPVAPNSYEHIFPYLVLDEYFKIRKPRSTHSHRYGHEQSSQNSINHSDYIGLISNNYNICFVKIDETMIVIGVAYTNNFLSISHIGRSAQALSQQNYRGQTRSTQRLPHIGNHKHINTWSRTPTDTYNNSILLNHNRHHTQTRLFTDKKKKQQIAREFEHSFIPREIVQKLFLTLDTNKDNRVDIEDIRREFIKNNFNFNDQIYKNIYQDAISQRSVIFKQEMEKGITLKQLQNALLSRKQLAKDNIATIDKPFKQYWFMLLAAMGYNQLMPKHLFDSLSVTNIHTENNLYECGHSLRNRHKKSSRLRRSIREAQPREEEVEVNTGIYVSEDRVPIIGFEARAKYEKILTKMR